MITRLPPPPLTKDSAGGDLQTASRTSAARPVHCAPARVAHIAGKAKTQVVRPYSHLGFWTGSTVIPTLLRRVREGGEHNAHTHAKISEMDEAVFVQCKISFSYPLYLLLGACPLENALVRYSKAQRPTSLPIQPFVLIPADKQQAQAQHLGCLLEQYINQKSSKSSSSEPGLKGKGKSSRCFSNLRASPTSSCRPIFLEAPSSSDTCSTCTPSPECFGRRHTWSQASRSQGLVSPCTSKSSLGPSHTSPKPRSSQELDKTSPCSGRTQTNSCLNLTSAPNQSSRFEIPTCEDLIELTPEQSYVDHQPQNNTSYHSIFSHTPPILPLTTDTRHPNLQVSSSTPTLSQTEKKPPQRRATPSADSGFFHGSFTAALSSVTPHSSLSSLLSSAASGLHPQQMQDSAGPSGRQSQSQHSESLILSDRPPTEFFLSPDTSYESLSISHLQRRGEGQLMTDTLVYDTHKNLNGVKSDSSGCRSDSRIPP